MPYTVYFTGLVCLIDRRDDGSFKVAIPDGVGDGTGVQDPRQPWTPGKKLPVHRPYLIVRTEDHPETTTWPTAMITSGMAFFAIDRFAKLTLQQAASGPIDATDFRQHAYRWSDIDSNFRLNPEQPNAFAWSVIKRGILRTFRHPGGEATIVQADIPLDDDTLPISITSYDGATSRTIEISNSAEVVIANVSDDYVNGAGGDGAEDFYIYYTLNEGGQQPNAKVPQPRPLPVAKTRHPFLDPQRDLHVSCSPTLYP